MKAAELGNHTAQLYIGDHYYFGWVVEKNRAQGCEWYKKAAEGGNTEAMIRLGWCYQIGDGVQVDDSQAEAYLLDAIKNGDEEASFYLGLLFKFNDANKAIYWFTRYANHTLKTTGKASPPAVKSIKELGGNYDTKKGTTIDMQYAYADNSSNNATDIETFNTKLKKLTDKISWGITKDGTLILAGSGSMPLLKKYPWTKKSEKILAIHIGNGITSIGKDAFKDLSYTKKVIIPKSLKRIEAGGFYDSGSAKSIYITDLAAWCNIDFCDINSNPLRHNGDLYINGSRIINLTIPSHISKINSYAFYGCTSLKTITISNGTTTIEKGAFYGCAITSLTLPSTLKNIEDDAFYGNKITQLEIPEGVTSIGNNAFRDNQIAKLTLPSSLKNLGESAFRNNQPLSSLVIAYGITKISKYAFLSCINLSSVNIPNSVTVIAEQAFSRCKISKLILPNSVKTIEKWAFYDSLNRYSKLSINSSVESIGKDAFANENGAFNGTVINLPSWLNIDKSFNVGISKDSYRAYRPSAEEMYDKGYKYYDIKDYKTALEYFLKGTQSECASGSSSDVARCYLYAGWCYGDLNDYSNAIIMLEKAEELGNKNARSALKSYREILAMQKEMTKAKTEYDKGNFELAFEHYVKAYYENRTTTTANNLNIVPEYYEKKGDYNNALKFYSRIKSISVDSNVDERIVYCYEKLGNINGAIGVYKSKAEGGNKEYQYKLGGLYEKAKNKNLAIFWYRKAAEQQHLKAEEALAKYGIYIEKHNNQNKGNSNHNNHNHSQEQKQQTYTPEYGVRDVWVNCFDCHGTGKCSYCNGTGWCISTNGHGEYNSSYKCTICHGSGRCTYCYGSGGHYEKQQYQIR